MASIRVVDPGATNTSIVAGTSTAMEARVQDDDPSHDNSLTWSAVYEGTGTAAGGFTGSPGPIVTYDAPDTVLSQDAAGSKLHDRVVVTVQDNDPSHHPPIETTFVVLITPKTPHVYCIREEEFPTDSVPDPASPPGDNHEGGGVQDSPIPDNPQNEGNQNEHKCCSINLCTCHAEGSDCKRCKEKHDKHKLCTETVEAFHSVITATAQGEIKAANGWKPLLTRGETLDLGVNHSNLPDGLVDAERPAGSKAMFGWQVRLVKDASNNVTIYWGKQKVEAWPSYGGTYPTPAGTFGTLTKQVDDSFSRHTKTGVYYDFNASGRLIQIKDRSSNGNVIYYNYDAGASKVIQITGPGLPQRPYFSYNGNRVERMTLETGIPASERLTYYRYDPSGRMTVMHQPEGVVTYFDYDVSGNLSKEIDARGRTTYFWYTGDAVPRVLRVLLPEGAGIYFQYDDVIPRRGRTQIGAVGLATGTTVYYDYNWAGRPKARIESAGGAFLQVQYYSFDGNAQPTLRKNPDGGFAYYEWDSNGSLLYRRDSQFETTYFTYGPFGRITSQKDPLGRVSYWNYNTQGLQTQGIDPLGRTTYFERDSFGSMVSQKDRRGNTTYYTYDTYGRHTSSKFANDTVRYYDYNAASEIEKLVDEGGAVNYYDHDRLGRVTKWKDGLGQATQYVYDAKSNRTIEIDRRGFAWYWEYDGLSRTVARRTALGHTTYFNYTANNLLSSTVDPRGNSSYLYYDGQKRLQCSENALGEHTYYTCDQLGRLTSQKDPRSFTTYFQYDLDGQRIKVIDAAGQWTYFGYDGAGNLTSQMTQDGTTMNVFDFLNRPTARVDALGRASYFYYDQEGNQSCSEDALGRLSYFYFDSRDRVFCQEDAQKNRAYYTYDARSHRSSAKDPRGNVTYFYQDALGRSFATRDARNGVTYMQFDAESDVITQKSARGFASYYTFDSDRRRQSAKTPLAELTYYTYDAAANQTSVKDARGNHAYFYFDALNRTFCSEDAKQAKAYFTYDASGNRISAKDPLARIAYTEYDGLGRTTAANNPIRNVRYFEYLRFGGGAAGLRYDTTKDERGYVTYSYFDELLRVKGTHSPIGAWTYFEYDRVNNRTATKDPLGRFNYFYYDTLNRLQAAEDGLGKRMYYVYDAASNQVSIKNPRLGTETGVQYFTFDNLNRPNSFKNETANVWYYDYDASSNLQVQRNPLGALTYWQYDSLERKVSQKDPLARTWYWAYDAVGNVSSLKDGKAQLTSYVYDSVNLQERVDYPDATKHYYEYDLARQRTAMSDPTGRTTFAYDAVGRMTERANPGSQNLYYTYDAAGNRTSLKDPDGVVQGWNYDGANRKTSAGSAGYGLQPYGTSPYGGYFANYEYDLASQLSHERRANGAITYYGYDAAGRQCLIQHRKAAGTLIESWAYTRDEAGNIIKSLRGTDSMNTYWDYDQASRVTKEAWRSNAGVNIYGFTYTYDAAGNRQQRRRTIGTPSSTYWDYDLADQTTRQKQDTTTTVYFTFNANGNLSVEHDVDASAGRTYYDYDPRNLLTRVDFPGATATNYFYYNALGERARKDDSTGGKKYTWDGLDVIGEKNLFNTTTQRLIKGYTMIPGIGAYAVQELASGLLYAHRNQVGTTMRHTDSTETVVNTYEYDAWGVPLVTTEGGSTAQQYRFTGKELDPDFIAFNSQNRRYHFPARFYLPNRGVFGQVDPLFEKNKRALYSYAANTPTRFVDPDGREECPCIVIDLTSKVSAGLGEGLSLALGFGGVIAICKFDKVCFGYKTGFGGPGPMGPLDYKGDYKDTEIKAAGIVGTLGVGFGYTTRPCCKDDLGSPISSAYEHFIGAAFLNMGGQVGVESQDPHVGPPIEGADFPLPGKLGKILKPGIGGGFGGVGGAMLWKTEWVACFGGLDCCHSRSGLGGIKLASHNPSHHPQPAPIDWDKIVDSIQKPRKPGWLR